MPRDRLEHPLAFGLPVKVNVRFGRVSKLVWTLNCLAEFLLLFPFYPKQNGGLEALLCLIWVSF